MTCIIGYIEGGKVYMGGDSAGVSGLNITVRRDVKVFTKGEFIMGYTSSFRMGQILRFQFSPPPIVENQDIYEYMCTSFIEAVRSTFEQLKFGSVESEDGQTGGCFLVGFRGRLFKIESDFQVGESYDPFISVGCGESFAHGALEILQKAKKLSPKDKILLALEVAEKRSGGVKAPFNIVETVGE